MVVILSVWLVVGFIVWCLCEESVVSRITKPWKMVLFYLLLGPFGWGFLTCLAFMYWFRKTKLDKKLTDFFTS